MFSSAIFINNVGLTLNPFGCEIIRSYIREEVMTMSVQQFMLSREFIPQCRQLVLIGTNIFGDQFTDNVIFVKDLQAAIKHLSATYADRTWWFIGDNADINSLIKQGLIMNVYLSKICPSEEHWSISIQDEQFDSLILYESDFDLISTTGIHTLKTTRHFRRQNVEELTLLNAMKEVITNGFRRPNRTGIDTRALFGKQFEYTMVERIDPITKKSSYRFPLLTTKKMFVRGVFAELKWFLSGGTNSKELESQGVNIWKGNSSREYLDSIGLQHFEDGECGKIYGHQWRNWGGDIRRAGTGIDQVRNVIDSLKNDPFGRRHIINGWNVADIANKELSLPPCHILYVFMVREKDGQKYLSLMMTQRSCDVFLGLPFNIVSCSMFLLIMAHQVNMKPDRFIHSIADFHLYESHIDAATLQIQRNPCAFPYISINGDQKDDPKDYDYSDIEITDYHSYPSIRVDMIA